MDRQAAHIARPRLSPQAIIADMRRHSAAVAAVVRALDIWLEARYQEAMQKVDL